MSAARCGREGVDLFPLLTAAGLWDEWKDRATGVLKSCTMIVTDPNDFRRGATECQCS